MANIFWNSYNAPSFSFIPDFIRETCFLQIKCSKKLSRIRLRRTDGGRYDTPQPVAELEFRA